MPKTYDVTFLLLTQIWAKVWSAKYACTAKDWLPAHLSENSVNTQHLEGHRPVRWKSNDYLILNERWEALKVFLFEIMTTSFCTSAAWDSDKRANINIWQVRTIVTSFRIGWYHWHRKLQVRPIVPDRTVPESLCSEQTRHFLVCLILPSHGRAYFWVHHTGL